MATLNMQQRRLRVCVKLKRTSIGMVASVALLPPLLLLEVPCSIWIVEAIALMFFGISWLTKSQCYTWLFKDKN